MTSAISDFTSRTLIRDPCIWIGEAQALIVSATLDGLASAIVAIFGGFDGDIYVTTNERVNFIRPYNRITTINVSCYNNASISYRNGNESA